MSWNVAAVVALAAACGSEKAPAANLGKSGTAGQGGTAGISGSGGRYSGSDSGSSGADGGDAHADGGDSGTDLDMGPSDDDRLRACYPEQKCIGSGAQFVEGMRFVDTQQAKCLLLALRDRTPGLYSFTTILNPLYGGPVTTSTTLFAVLADGSALTASPGAPRSGEHCQIGLRAHLDECLAALENPDAGVSGMPAGLERAWDCTYYKMGWFESCAPESPIVCR